MGDLGDAYAAMSVQKCPCGAQPQGHPSGLCDACVAKRSASERARRLGAAPAPTPTPAPGIDLDAVERAERAMTPGPWRHGSVERHHVFCSEGDRSLLCPEAGRVLLRMNEHFPHDSDAAGIVTLRNAAPALIAEVRALRAAAEEREADMHARIRAGYDKTVADAWRAEVAKRDAEIADLRALVESQRRDYLDVCDAIAPETSGPADAAAKVRALRAAFAEAKRLGLEACDRATHTEQCGKTQADYHHSKGYRGCPGEDEDCTCGLAAIAAALEAL